MSETFYCEQCQASFDLTEEDLAFYQKKGIEIPELCFACDQKSRLCFRSEWHLYKRKCDYSGDDIVSIYQPDAPYPVYKSEHWLSTDWSALDYGRPFDFNRPFFEQFAELQAVVPRLALSNMYAENSDFCNMTVGNRNCYYVFGGDQNQDVMYNSMGMRNHKSFDLSYSDGNEASYMLTDSSRCTNSQYLLNSQNCTNSYYSSDCSGCDEIVLCTNQMNKSYMIENVQYSKEEYMEKKKQLLNGSYSQHLRNMESLQTMMQERIVRSANFVNCTNCTGDYLRDCTDCQKTYDASECTSMSYVISAVKSSDCVDGSHHGDNSVRCFNSVSTYNAHDIMSSYFVVDSSNVEYSEAVFGSSNVFGCEGMLNREYCIFNVQYSKEEYTALRAKIVEHMKRTEEWGKFFPAQLSMFGYNETSAYTNFPLDESEAVAAGFRWQPNVPESSAEHVIPADSLYDYVDAIRDNILESAIGCANCTKAFRLRPQELEFYRQYSIPIPRHCPRCRNDQRLALRNPRTLHSRPCAECSDHVQTTFAIDRPETVLCADCYDAECC